MSKEAKRYSCGNGDGMIEDKNGFYVKYSQTTQFKVATEDSCVVLDEPKMEDYLIEKDSLKYDTIALECAIIEYDKAPLISKTELKLNKMRVKVEFLEAALSVSNKLNKSEELTEANKQLKEYKEVVAEQWKQLEIDIYDCRLDAGDGGNNTDMINEAIETLSKLNKD